MMSPNSTSGNLIGRDLEGPFHSLHQEINRLFGEVVLHGRLHHPQGPLMPSINVRETDGEMQISADLPGVKANDIDVTLVDDILTIRAERTLEKNGEKENFHVLERSYGTFLRTLRLPYSVDTDNMKADFDNGVLTVTLPINTKKEQARKIPVQCGARDRDALSSDQAKATTTSTSGAPRNADPKPKTA